MARELGAVVGDDPCWNSKATHQIFQELDSSLSSNLSHSSHFRPLRKLVYRNEQEFKAPDFSGEVAEDIEPPDRKWP